MNKIITQDDYDMNYFFELSPDLICITDFKGQFKKVNNAVCKTLCFLAEEIQFHSLEHFIHPADKQLTADKWAEMAAGETLLNFENRLLRKDGAIIWLNWTAVPIKRDRLIFAIGKNVTYRKHIKEYERISDILEMIHEDHNMRYKKVDKALAQELPLQNPLNHDQQTMDPSSADQLWLNKFEAIVRKHTGKLHLNLNLISDELAMSERQLYRLVNKILGITPNKLVRIIRLQLAWEAIASGKHRTIAEISHMAGYSSRAHFSRLFKNIYGINVSELL